MSSSTKQSYKLACNELNYWYADESTMLLHSLDIPCSPSLMANVWPMLLLSSEGSWTISGRWQLLYRMLANDDRPWQQINGYSLGSERPYRRNNIQCYFFPPRSSNNPALAYIFRMCSQSPIQSTVAASVSALSIVPYPFRYKCNPKDRKACNESIWKYCKEKWRLKNIHNTGLFPRHINESWYSPYVSGISRAFF